ncbi:MAG: hypothetical protein DRG80_05070 [Deltaproteobacteria bacterium]|nr:MAG: hypothetical protein DRG80_05070 [Deltaproteobacteria bacterium]
MRRKSAFLTVFFMYIGIAWFLPHSVRAKVQGQSCDNCHIMHNSQAGQTVASEAQRHLLCDTCIGCHTGTNDGVDTTPYVMSSIEPTYSTPTVPGNTLAGGNFYWVATTGEGNDTKGHNVLGLSNEDVNIPASAGAPGGGASCSNSCHMTLAAEQTVYPELGSGCEGCHLEVKHHADDSATVVGEAGGYYRFLAGHDSGDGHGVEGIEDSDWEYQPTSTAHNEYFGLDAGNVTDTGFHNLGNTMTAYCCGCHGAFHSENGGWRRHPADAVIPDKGEYSLYTTYSTEAPVARPDLSSYTGASQTVTPGTDLVMCLSCHRAHGSPYHDMLRWDYSGHWCEGSDNTGCCTCHTSKDD